MPQLKDKSKASPDLLIAELRERVRLLEDRVDALTDAPGTSKRYMKSFGTVTDNEVTRDAEQLGQAYRNVDPRYGSFQ